MHASNDRPTSVAGLLSLAPIRTACRALNRLRSGIGLRLLASVLLLSTAITLLLTLLQLYVDYRRDVERIERRMSEIEGSYLRSLGEGLWNLDVRQLELQIDGILRLPAIRFVEVRETTDRADPMVVTAGSHQRGAAMRREFLIFRTVRDTEQRLGVLSIEATLDEVYRELLDRAIIILANEGAKIFIVSFFILFITYRVVTRHLVATARFLGSYDVRRPPPPLRLERRPHQWADELDQLVEAFNRMCTTLQTVYREQREGEQRFRDYAETASDWFWATDPNHRFTYFSGAVETFGYDWVNPLGKRRYDVAADVTTEPEKWREHMVALDRHEPFRDFGYKIRRIDGSLGFVSVSGKPVFDDEGRFSGYRGVARDLSDRKRAEQALQRSEAYLAEAQRLSHTGSWAWNVATRKITHWSQEIYRLYGFDPPAGIPAFDALVQRVHPEDRARVGEALASAIRVGAEYEMEFRVVLPDGATKHIHEIGHPVRDAAGDVVEFVGTAMDITERKLAEEEVRESERRYREVQMELARANRVAAMGQLTASIAHEVNQPIAATVTNAQAALRWLDRGAPDLEEVRQALARIVKDGSRAGDVVARIRDLIEKAPPRKDRLDINAAICDVIALTRGEAVESGVSVETDLAEGLPLIRGDRVQLQQVILNLIINALEAMSSVGDDGKRELVISTGPAKSSGVLVALADTGPGVAPDCLERLFDAFYTTKPGGLGVGLSICRSIVEAHGGRLWASANLPHGAIFQFALPADRDSTT
jgi:PAS domain S-box-containing protein